MNPETMKYINAMFCCDVAEKRRMMMDAIENGFDDDFTKRRIEAYREAYIADKDFSEWWKDQIKDGDEDGS